MAPALRLGGRQCGLCDAAKSEAIKLDLYHLVDFAVCSVLGLVGETVVSYFR